MTPWKSKKSKLVIDDEVEDTDVEDEEIEAELVPNLVERGLGRGRPRSRTMINPDILLVKPLSEWEDSPLSLVTHEIIRNHELITLS